MKPEYVKNLGLPPSCDQKRVKEEHLVKDTYVPSEQLVEYAIINFLEAAEAYYDDYDSTKIYYKVETSRGTFDLHFDIRNMKHIFGIPGGNEAEVEYKISEENPWLPIFERFFKEDKDYIIEYDCDEENAKAAKLSWDRVGIKVFSLLNLGIISQGEAKFFRKTQWQRKIDDFPEYLIVRDIISEGVEGQIELSIVYDGKCWVPSSIRYSETKKNKRIEHGEKGRKKIFSFAGFATITQMGIDDNKKVR